MSVLLLNNIALTLCGVVTILTPFMPSYEMLVVYACLFGFSIAGIVSIRSILLVELLGLDKLTNSFGLMLPFTGVSACVGGPLAGNSFGNKSTNLVADLVSLRYVLRCHQGL